MIISFCLVMRAANVSLWKLKQCKLTIRWINHCIFTNTQFSYREKVVELKSTWNKMKHIDISLNLFRLAHDNHHVNLTFSPTKHKFNKSCETFFRFLVVLQKLHQLLLSNTTEVFQASIIRYNKIDNYTKI